MEALVWHRLSLAEDRDEGLFDETLVPLVVASATWWCIPTQSIDPASCALIHPGVLRNDAIRHYTTWYEYHSGNSTCIINACASSTRWSQHPTRRTRVCLVRLNGCMGRPSSTHIRQNTSNVFSNSYSLVSKLLVLCQHVHSPAISYQPRYPSQAIVS
jgi:hypothetical protein